MNFQKRKQLVRQCIAGARNNCLCLPQFISGWLEVVNESNSKCAPEDKIIIAIWKNSEGYCVHSVDVKVDEDTVFGGWELGRELSVAEEEYKNKDDAIKCIEEYTRQYRTLLKA